MTAKREGMQEREMSVVRVLSVNTIFTEENATAQRKNAKTPR